MSEYPRLNEATTDELIEELLCALESSMEVGDGLTLAFFQSEDGIEWTAMAMVEETGDEDEDDGEDDD